MTRIAKDIIAGDDFVVNVFDAKKQDLTDNYTKHLRADGQ